MNFCMQTNNISFKGYYDKYFDKLEEDSFDSFKYIPDYKEPTEKAGVPLEYFMRDYELFDKQKDILDSNYSKYSDDDLFVNRDSLYHDIPKSVIDTSNCVENPYFITEFRLPKQKQIYTAENSFSRKQESFKTRLDEGFSRDEVKKVYHSALVNKGTQKVLDYDLANDGFNLVKSGKNIKDVEKIMNGSKMDYADGSARYSRELFDFLTSNPEARELAVDSINKYEFLRRDVISEYSRIRENCQSDSDVTMIIKACQIEEKGKKKIDTELVDLCIKNIESGKNTKNVTTSIRQAKLKTNQISEEFDRGLFEFFLENPDTRDLVVRKKGDSEKVRYDVMRFYPEIKKVCKKKDDIKNVIEVCQVGPLNNKKLDEYFTNKCLEKIKNGDSVKDAVSDIRQAKLFNGNGFSAINKDLYDFLEIYPESRDIVVMKSYRGESYKPEIAQVYSVLAEECDNPNDVADIIKSCKIRTGDNVNVDKRLLGLAVNLYSKNSEWLYENDAIMYSVRNSGGQNINEKKYELAKAMADGSYSINSIYNAVVLNNKNVELMK